FARRLGADFDSAVERIVFVEQGQVCAPPAKELFEHFTEVDPYLSKGLAEQLFRSRVDLRNHIQQSATRIGKVIVLRFEKLVSLFQFVVLVNSVQVNWPHVIELRSKVANKLFDIRRGELWRARRRRRSALHFVIAFQLRSQSFFKRNLVLAKFAQIDLVSA